MATTDKNGYGTRIDYQQPLPTASNDNLQQAKQAKKHKGKKPKGKGKKGKGPHGKGKKGKDKPEGEDTPEEGGDA